MRIVIDLQIKFCTIFLGQVKVAGGIQCLDVRVSSNLLSVDEDIGDRSLTSHVCQGLLHDRSRRLVELVDVSNQDADALEFILCKQFLCLVAVSTPSSRDF